jgi:PAS domain S-box-containing protein
MDIRTLAIVLGIINVVQVLVLALQATTNRIYRGSRWWLLWSASAALGFPFILLRSIPSIERVSILAQNGLIVLGVYFLYVGIMRFLEKRENARLVYSLYGAYLTSLAYFTYWKDDIGARTVLICLMLAAASLLSAYALLVHAQPAIRTTARFCAFVFLAHACVVLHRAAMVAAGTDVRDMYDPTPFNLLLYLDGILASLLWTFGLIIMVSQRSYAETKEAKDRFELLFHTSPDAVIITRAADGLCREVNEGLLALSGFSRSEIVGRSLLDLHVYDNPTDRQSVVDEIRQKGFCENVEVPFRRKDKKRLTGILSARLFPLDGVPHVISVIRDISERKLAETAVRETEERFRTFFEQSPLGHSIVAPDGRIQRVNPALCQILGYSAEELAVTSFADITHPDDLAKSQEALSHLLEGRHEALSVETRYVTRDGRTAWAQVDASLARDSEGRPLHLLMHVLDISERKRTEVELRRILSEMERSRLALLSVVEDQRRTEEALRESERKLNEAQAMAGLGYWYWDVKTGDVEWSGELFKIFGLDPSSFSPHIDSILALSPWPEDHERDRELIGKAVVSRDQGAYEQRFLRPDGSMGFYYSTFQGKYDDTGGLVAIVGTVLDITERKRADQALRRHAERLQNLHRLDQAILQGIEAPADLAHSALSSLRRLLQCDLATVAVFDLDTGEVRVLAALTEGEDMVREGANLPEEEYGEWEGLRLGRPQIVEELSEAGLAATPGQLHQVGRIRSSVTVPLLSERGLIGALKVGWKERSAISLEDNEIASEVAGQITRAIEQDRVVKERKRHADELEERVAERTAQLGAANEELEAFTYSVSHDLRAPLRAINGYAQILTEGHGPALDAEGQRVLGIIRAQALRMGHLIDDLLQFSRFGRHPLWKVPIDMTTQARDLLSELVAQTPARKVGTRVSPLPEAFADPSLIRQVWLNLLDNALKFTRHRDQAEIVVGGETEGKVAIYWVKDNGAGFDMNYADKLFGVFQRLHGADEFEGTGVGLALVQRLIHRHGGRVWAEAEVNRGATFYFTLPIGEETAAPNDGDPGLNDRLPAADRPKHP